METPITSKSHRILAFNFLAFTVCFAIWMFNGVLVTFLVDSNLQQWNAIEIGWLMGIPVLTGSLFRLPLGMMTDKFGGKWVLGGLLVFLTIPLYLLSKAETFWDFVWCSLGFGMAGNCFSIGIAFTSMWYPQRWQGRALGIFAAGNAGAGITTMLAPTLLKNFTENGTNLEGWRTLPLVYAMGVLIMAVLFIIFTENRKATGAVGKSFIQMLSPLKYTRVWRFGLYYYLVFGCFVALSQWLVPYFVNMYAVTLVTAGILASIFSLPSGLIRILGGWISDKFGARRTMYWVLGSSIACCIILLPPTMKITTTGEGVMAKKKGKVTEVTDSTVKVDGMVYPLVTKRVNDSILDGKGFHPLPKLSKWQTSVVKVGDEVKKKQLLARGESIIYFQANVWIATILIFIVGIVWGIGKSAVFKYIPDYFPNDVGTVGGMVGLLGGLGGFISPIIFGYLLSWTGVWTSMWIFLLFVSIICIWWLHETVTKMMKKISPDRMKDYEDR